MYSPCMRVVPGRAALAASGQARRPVAFVIGNFDGVHLGHQALLHAARERAAATGGEVGVLTFDPHPAKLFAPALAPPLIVSLQPPPRAARRGGRRPGRRRALHAASSPSIEAPAFVREVLARDLSARDVVVGYDFSFGRGRKGDTRLLAAEGAALGIGVTVVPPRHSERSHLLVDQGARVCARGTRRGRRDVAGTPARGHRRGGPRRRPRARASASRPPTCSPRPS